MRLSRLLLVDDNKKFLDMSREFLESECDHVIVVGTAGTAEEALKLIRQARPTLLIVDLAMPDMSGLELTQRVKQTRPELPVIILTLFDTPRHRQAALEAGADAFVAKASMDSDLIPAIERLSSSGEC